MRLALRIDLSSLAPCAALCAAVALIALPVGVNAQESALAQSANTTDTAHASSATLVGTTPAAVASPAATVADDLAPATDSSQLAANTLSTPADTTPTNDISLDDQVLSRQRGGAVGMLMVAATPQLMRGTGSSGNSVTLWDEIAPPSPLPIPVDAARAAQGNVASYQRK